MTNKPNPMTPDAARRIQAAADRAGTNQDAKARVMSTAAKNQGTNAPKAPSSPGPHAKR